MARLKGRFFRISGRVQGVGYRDFAYRAARDLCITGWVRNRDDGKVEIHACGTLSQLDEYEGRLRMGPRLADVRSVEVHEEAVLDLHSFDIR